MAKKDDEAEMKQRGLDISNRAREEGTEKTGFFQRLREGNIDDPNSAAYKKYGAGRARLDDKIKAGELKLADDVQKKVKDDADFAEADRVSSTARSVAGKPAEKPAPSAKPKSGIVTKEQLAKSGFDNLRDYMNAEKGLKRRDGSKTEKAPSKTTTETKPAGLTAKADKPAAGTSSLRDPQQMAKQKEAPAASNKKPEPFEMPITRVLRAIRERGDADLKSRGMAKGGSINGIAKRGLTRCKTV
jgi:hypothetical protein